MAALKSGQDLLEEVDLLARRTGCETRRLFNYLFYFGSKSGVEEAKDHICAIYAASAHRQLEMSIDVAEDVYLNKSYICWLLTVADHLIKRGEASTGSEHNGALSLRHWLAGLEKIPIRAVIEAAFVPTIDVMVPPGRNVKSRFPNGLNVAELQQAIEQHGEHGDVLLLLDGDGIKKARSDTRRPTLFAMHEIRVYQETQGSGDFADKMARIYAFRLRLDGLFDKVVSQIVGGIVSLGYVAQYLGGDELVAIAPANIVANVVETACAAAPFEIAFSCGKSEVSAFRSIEEGFNLAESDLGQAKSLARRGAFNMVL